ncbi:MAG: EamA family transporter, partial [Oscillospiraceae bacterium]|nr:EamA family transporter [Oscillospiraceae bacterium]
GKLPELRYILPAVLIGFVAYGLSIFTYIRAQKTLGAAKTSAYYAIAPFIGAMLSFIFLRESLTITYMTAFVIMVVGTVFVVSDTLLTNDSMKKPE